MARCRMCAVCVQAGHAVGLHQSPLVGMPRLARMLQPARPPRLAGMLLLASSPRLAGPPQLGELSRLGG